MRSRGFSLLELVVLMALVSILLSIATLNFREYLQRSKMEAQTRFLYGQLLKARVDAVCQRRTIAVKVYPGRFEVYSSQIADGVEPLQTHLLNFPITWNASSTIEFDKNGITSDFGALCLESTAGGGAVDSVVVSTTRITIGKKDKGDECDTDNITAK